MAARDWWVMAALMVGIMLSPLNVMFTSVALPTMRDYFQVDIEQATWIGTAYFIPSVALMPFQSQLGQRWGFRRIYGIGLLVLAFGAFWAALAPTYPWLLAGRVIQGIGWAALYPLALILINNQYPAARQGEMLGLWESSVGLTTIIAPLIGGLLVQFLSWRSLYALIGLAAALGALLTRVVVPAVQASQRDAGQRKERSDWLSVLILTLALTLTLLGITRRNAVLLIIAALAWLGWAWFAGRLKTPTIPTTVFANRRFVSASVAANIRMLVAIAALTALPLFFEDVQGLSPTLVGLLMVVYSLFLFLGSWPGGRWSDRAGAAVPGAVGYLAMIVGILMLLGLGYQLVAWLAILAFAIRGLGAGLSQAPYAKAATEAVLPEQKQAAAGLYGTIRYSGLALGTALVGILLQMRLTDYGALSGGAAALPAYRELWLILAAILVIGLGATLIMARSQPAKPMVEMVKNGSA
ncbi:MAG TPA: MFS transporter [Anaerolineae bacterium]|nr:MFS transporter [Anaerolineae bacterium]